MLVGISETIRSLFVKKYNLLNILIQIFNFKLNTIKLNISYLYFFIFKLFIFTNNILGIFKYNLLIFFSSLVNNNNNDKTLNHNSQEININNIDPNLSDIHNNRFLEWLAGLIDGDGCFLLSKKGYASLEITMDIRDQHCLYQIKQKFGGSVKLLSGSKAIRYRLHHRKGLLDLIKALNGEIRNPVRILQMERLLKLYNIEFKKPKSLTYNNGWFSGIFDSDGSIYLNEKSGQIFISVSQKDIYILDALVELYGGKIYPHGNLNAFKFVISRKSEILDLIKNYFSKYPSRTDRISRLSLVSDFYYLRNLHAHNSSPKSEKGKAWHYFLVKWNKYTQSKEK
jgi:hypothetical protein